MSDKDIIEAALFTAGCAVNINALAKLTGKSVKKITPVVNNLMREYQERAGGLEIIDLGERYAMQVRQEYTEKVHSLAPKELRSPVLRTLSMIAYHQPVIQAELVDMRGNSAYDHIRELKERGLIRAVPHGRTKLLQTTSLFADYFGLKTDDPETIKKKIVELSKQQSGDQGLNRWLGRKFVGITPMYESLVQLCGIKDYRIINAYDPEEEELDELNDIFKLVISKGYMEKVSKIYDGEIIEASSVTFDDLIATIKQLESVSDLETLQNSIRKIEDLKKIYASKALTIHKKVLPATDMITRIVNDLRIGVAPDGIVIAPDYKRSSEGEIIGEDADILVPTHKSVEGDLIHRICARYDAIIEGLKEPGQTGT